MSHCYDIGKLKKSISRWKQKSKMSPRCFAASVDDDDYDDAKDNGDNDQLHLGINPYK